MEITVICSLHSFLVSPIKDQGPGVAIIAMGLMPNTPTQLQAITATQQ